MGTGQWLLLATLCVTVGVTQAPAQSFLKKLKSVGKQLVKEAVEEVAPEPVKKAVDTVNKAENKVRGVRNRASQSRSEAESARVASFHPSTKVITVKFCEGVGRKLWYGRVGGTTPEPPDECAKEPAWARPLPSLYHENNARLFAEHEMLEKRMFAGKGGCETMLVRRESAMGEASDRTSALATVVNCILDNNPDDVRDLGKAMENDAFKRAVASDLAPIYPYLDARVVQWLKSIDPKTKTVDVTVAEGNSSSDVMVQQGEMWFNVNTARQDAVLEGLDMDQSVGKDYTVPATIVYAGRTFKVTGIGDGAFADLKVRSVTLSEGLKTIGAYAFARTGISGINIPSTVTEIENYAFNDNPALKTVVVPDNVTKMGTGVFSMCTGLATVTLPGRVDEMGNTMFWGCSALTQVTLPQNLTTVPVGMFEDCKSLTRVDLPAGLTTIDQNAFKKAGLTQLSLPASLTSIRECAFEGCSRLTSLSVPTGVSLGFMSFKDCKGLKKVAVGKQYEAAPYELYSAFMGCSFVDPHMTKTPACVSYNE